MFLRAMITGYDWTTETYELMYTDGPYLGDEQPDKQHHFAAQPNHPKAHFFVRNVSSAHIIVDLYDNYGSHLPIFLVGISLFQVFSFLHFCFVVDTDSNLTSTSPIAGHEWTWMRIVSDFPACSDLRPECNEIRKKANTSPVEPFNLILLMRLLVLLNLFLIHPYLWQS